MLPPEYDRLFRSIVTLTSDAIFLHGLVPTAFVFSTGTPDARVATISEPPNAHNSQVEFESGDDFALTAETVITHASFTGLLTGGATLKDVSNVFITVYRVFPNDSD